MTLEIAAGMGDESIIQIYNINGQREKELRMAAGEQKASFSVDDMAAGFYILKWISGSKEVNKKIIVVK